jgi:hypothetical protein
MGPRRRLQRNARQPRNFREVLLKFVDDFQRALRFIFGSKWMKIRKAAEYGATFSFKRELYFIVHGAERVHALIDRIIPGRDAREVSNDVNLRDLGHARQVGRRVGSRAE